MDESILDSVLSVARLSILLSIEILLVLIVINSGESTVILPPSSCIATAPVLSTLTALAVLHQDHKLQHCHLW